MISDPFADQDEASAHEKERGADGENDEIGSHAVLPAG
jgi:hypothetical protein